MSAKKRHEHAPPATKRRETWVPRNIGEPVVITDSATAAGEGGNRKEDENDGIPESV